MRRKNPTHRAFETLKLNQTGSLSILLCLWVLITVLSGLGILGFSRLLRTRVDTQLRLDRCVGEIAIEFRNELNRLVFLNRTIFRAKSNIKLAQVTGQFELIPGHIQTIETTVLKQDLVFARWHRRSWRICALPEDSPRLFPRFEDYLERLPPGVGEGPGPLALKSLLDSSVVVTLADGRRSSSAEIFGGTDGSTDREAIENREWQARWIVPRI